MTDDKEFEVIGGVSVCTPVCTCESINLPVYSIYLCVHLCVPVCTPVYCSDKLADDEEFEVIGDVSEAQPTADTATSGNDLCTNDGLLSVHHFT